jgi:hypothetical protein
MKLLRSVLAAGVALILGTSAAVAACNVAFTDDVQSLFTKKSVACHNDRSPGSGVSLQKGSSIANLVDVPSTELPAMMRVVPGDSASSYLAHKLLDTHLDVGGSGKKMPLSGRLKDEEIAAIISWIDDCEAAE